MPSFECKRLPCLVVRLLISSCPIGTNRTLYPFLHWNGRFAMKWGFFAMEWGIFAMKWGIFAMKWGIFALYASHLTGNL